MTETEKKPNFYLAIGTMSGTSMDGIDVAMIQTDGELNTKLIQHHSLSYPPHFQVALKKLEYEIREADDKLGFLSNQQSIIQQSTDFHLKAINTLIEKTPINTQNAIIGYHGQTIYHQPKEKLTLQIGFANQIARSFNRTVVSDFRSNDIQEGGQGAPFAPLFHRALVLQSKLSLPCAVINCGGITNASVITGKEINDVFGFDIGPGNVLLDRYIRLKTSNKMMMDKDGHFALQGRVNPKVLSALFEKACLKPGFYEEPPPKSLDSYDFELIPELDNLSIQDGAATLAAFTAATIKVSLQSFLNQHHLNLKTIILAGGGWKHPVITRELLSAYPLSTSIKTADEIGWNNAALEAQIFAYLAVRSIQNKPLSLPSTTGVTHPLPGGKHNYP